MFSKGNAPFFPKNRFRFLVYRLRSFGGRTVGFIIVSATRNANALENRVVMIEPDGNEAQPAAVANHATFS
jgi:hypothetical protein